MTSYGRGEFDGFSSYQSGGGGSSASGGSKMSQLINAIGSNIQKMTQNVSQMQRYVNQIGTPQDSEGLRGQCHQVKQQINHLAQETNRDLKQLAHLSVPPSEQSKLRLQKDRLTSEFTDVLTSFQTLQRTEAEKEKASVERARSHSSSKPFFEEDKQDDFQAQGFSQTKQVLQMEEDVDLEMIREREDAIKQLERDIVDVNQIFKDLGMLVHEQGETLDVIEANVESAQMSVVDGTQQLRKARESQSAARRKKCCCIVILATVLAVVAIIVVIVMTTKSNN